MAKPYKEDGEGTIWIKEEEKEEAIEKIQKHSDETEPVFGDDFETEEIFVETYGDPYLSIAGSIEEIFVNQRIPIKDTGSMKQIVKDLSKYVDVNEDETGLFIKSNDLKEVKTKKTDVAGRFNLGTEYSEKEVKVAIIEK